MIRRLALGARRYSSKPDTGKWKHLEQSFDIDKIRTEERVEISPNLLPNLPSEKLVYEPSEFFSLAKKRYEATNNQIKRLEGVTKPDRFAELNVNPLDLWKSPTALSSYITTNGRIMPGYVNGNKGATQKKLSKAIRRCRAAGLLSTVHRSVFESN